MFLATHAASSARALNFLQWFSIFILSIVPAAKRKGKSHANQKILHMYVRIEWTTPWTFREKCYSCDCYIIIFDSRVSTQIAMIFIFNTYAWARISNEFFVFFLLLLLFLLECQHSSSRRHFIERQWRTRRRRRRKKRTQLLSITQLLLTDTTHKS